MSENLTDDTRRRNMLQTLLNECLNDALEEFCMEWPEVSYSTIKLALEDVRSDAPEILSKVVIAEGKQ